ncbi:PDR/VanB family oxidoreductase [Nocardia seriolae]|uniref:Phthalate 4,5-dioxygenase n=1 Tax=Nocardia seriolae TaxID=37332 RepID=A0A0B8NFT0_9NOCA|nr:2Fe-2S iron-sulfur cluster binding domain-containing protein [Nocardia seriolae]MTJ71265.1 2Fe-2S iron-sulfur cluster binding domain-containing protein [Nocardia seriolae]MTJ86909.1 2Fe-2S iron-sulfur cluster binding domain-containing protein [Nocardia seriolae]MTK30904.1 2Fe-2S iron-sulfur cluster binding domain-containing protein [Nocardia seriolae]MTK43121.1 2Fe-2S iron-sulfur cluster binding domain-containing protein [Nocardia seriolae]
MSAWNVAHPAGAAGAQPLGLRVLGGAMDAYKRVFVAGVAAPLLSPPNPVRRSGFELATVVEKLERPVADVLVVTLRAAEGRELPSWRPGAHVDVFLPSGRQRQYSLCGDPADRRRYRIAVRLMPDGEGGSQEVHEVLWAGDRVRIRGPRNAFTLVDAPSYLFLAGGIGITPILPMVRAAGPRGRLVYAGRSRASMPFLDELPEADIRPDDEFGAPDVAALIARAAPGAAVYVCGPPAMLAAAQRCRFELDPTGSLHTERFSAQPVVDGRAFDLTLARSGRTVRVGAEETALAAVRRVLPEVNYSCRQGFCGTCKVGVRAGEVDHRDRLLTAAERADRMLLCVSRAAGDALVLDL